MPTDPAPPRAPHALDPAKLVEWKEIGPVADPAHWGAPDCCRAHADEWGPLVEAVRALIAEVERLQALVTRARTIVDAQERGDMVMSEAIDLLRGWLKGS